MPGRLYGEVRAFANSNGDRTWEPASFGVSFERLGTNLFGYYAGVTFNRRPIRRDSDTDRFEALVGGGLMVAFPLPVAFRNGRGSGMNLFSRAGMHGDGRTGFGAEFRIGVGFSYGSPYRKVGIRSRDESP